VLIVKEDSALGSFFFAFDSGINQLTKPMVYMNTHADRWFNS